MAEFEEKLGAILNDPQAMGQIMALAQSLGGKGEKNSEEPAVSATSDGQNIDPRLLEMGMKAISAYQDPNNEKALLLQALRPFVKETRYKKVDKAARIVRVSQAIRAVLDGFKGGEGGV